MKSQGRKWINVLTSLQKQHLKEQNKKIYNTKVEIEQHRAKHIPTRANGKILETANGQRVFQNPEIPMNMERDCRQFRNLDPHLHQDRIVFPTKYTRHI